MKKTRTLVLGATAFGIGYALSHPKDSIIVEKTVLLCPEFIHSMNILPCVSKNSNGLSNDFKTELFERNLLLSDGRFHAFPISGVFAKLLREYQVPVLLDTAVSKISQEESGFIVSMFHADGFTELFCENIIDTTSTGILHDHLQKTEYRKSFCGMLVCREEDLPKERISGISFLRGLFDDEFVIKIELPADASFSDARDSLHRQITAFPLLRLAYAAAEFAYDFKSEIDIPTETGTRWVPSASFGNLLNAFEEGTR